MRTAIIVNETDNISLLRFTESKLFFDAENQYIDFVQDCKIVDSYQSALELSKNFQNAIILRTGDFLTTTFRTKYNDFVGVIIADSDNVIKFNSETYVGFKKKCNYTQGSKQLYIIENLLKTCLKSKNLVYLDNTETVAPVPNKNYKHFYGLASGWKSIQLSNDIGFENLETITIYDKNEQQLEHAKWIHKNVNKSQIPAYKNVCGIYNPSAISVELWNKWKSYPVQFTKLDLFQTPLFKEHSLIWISNIFKYEPNIFNFGWEECKRKKKELFDKNPTCTFV